MGEAASLRQLNADAAIAFACFPRNNPKIHPGPLRSNDSAACTRDLLGALSEHTTRDPHLDAENSAWLACYCSRALSGIRSPPSPMTLNLDSSKAFRRPMDLQALAQAVLAADPADEADWIEWKSQQPLRTPEGRGRAACHILGFANRHPDRAARNAEGCGYLVIGVEPGRLVGAERIDPAELEAGMRPYLGDQTPQWSLHIFLSKANRSLSSLSSRHDGAIPSTASIAIPQGSRQERSWFAGMVQHTQRVQWRCESSRNACYAEPS
jgi:hypothetical protein